MNKPYAPSCERNREPILEVLRAAFGDRRRVLEIGSGTGQHAVHFAAALPELEWQTSERAENLHGLKLWLDEAGLPNTPSPLQLDISADSTNPWPERRYDAIFTANTLHIMHEAEVRTLFDQLGGVLAADAKLAIYGPFKIGGAFSGDGDVAFDAWLKQRDPLSGVRDFEAVDTLAGNLGFRLIERRPMPANNYCLIWHRSNTV